jgi:subtilisin family serine protease
MKPATLTAVLLLGALYPSSPAMAQIALPALRLPSINTAPLTNGLPQTLTAEDPDVFRKLRRATAGDLIRHNRDLIEADPHGDPALRGQLVAVGLSDESRAQITAAGFALISEVRLESLDTRVDILRCPAGTPTRRALQIARRLDAAASIDFDHLYQGSAASTDRDAVPAIAAEDHAVSRPGVRVGLIDGGVMIQHPSFRGSTIVPAGCDGHLVPSPHGTAVASLLVGEQPPFRGAAPGATLYSVDVYCGQPTGGSIDGIAQALAWLSDSRVAVINVSLVGPDNLVLRQLIRQMIARGHLIVAAVGNDGPSAPPLFPAAYPDVIGVTAVDAHRRLLVEAGRGAQVAFAAPGAEMAAANLPDGYAAVRGTSFAAPLVAGLLAAHMNEPDRAQAQAAVASLAGTAAHMGSSGRNPSYGFGVIAEDLRVSPDIMRAEENTLPDRSIPGRSQ